MGFGHQIVFKGILNLGFKENLEVFLFRLLEKLD